MLPNRNSTKEERQRAKELAASGKSQPEIIKLMNRSRWWVGEHTGHRVKRIQAKKFVSQGAVMNPALLVFFDA